jgi:serine/threonine protein kinase HipA of HipAB toxin-antitoxin module
MNNDFEKMSPEFDQLAALIKKLAEESRGDSLALLALLRLLEGLHREICEGIFQESFPDNRQALYALLRDIEAKGGWPYIRRMRLQDLLKNLYRESETLEGQFLAIDQKSETET